jgi:hypothetical protein
MTDTVRSALAAAELFGFDATGRRPAARRAFKDASLEAPVDETAVVEALNTPEDAPAEPAAEKTETA